ncbi:MAG TPA: GAF domain-containing protein [Miltoncostaeaceae bacterium]|nr:GAF domain-containing protein [Miltoncostaeaceae bacterium]
MAVARGQDLDSTLLAIVGAACALAGARYGALGVLGRDRRIARFITHGIAPALVERIGPFPTGRGILGVLIDEATPLRLRDIADDPRSVGFPPHHPPMASFLGVPVMARGEVFGNLYLTEKEGAEEFSQEDERTLVMFAAQAGVAIEDARLRAEMGHQLEELRRAAEARAAVSQIAQSILRERDVERVLRLLAERAAELVDARIAGIGLPEEESRTVNYVACAGPGAAALSGRSFPIDGSPSGAVLVTGQPCRLDDAAAAAELFPALSERIVEQLLVVALPGPESPLGVLLTGDKAGGETFTGEDEELLSLLGALGAIALQNARAFRREQDRARELVRLERAEERRAAELEARRRAAAAQEEERRRIAQDLHDRIGGMLTGGALMLKELEKRVRRLDDPGGELAASIEELRLHFGTTMDDLRDVIGDLHPRVLEQQGLEAALQRLCGSVDRRADLPVYLTAEPGIESIGGELAMAAFRIAQEALTNCARHSQASRVRVSASAADTQFTLVVEDDGIGADGAVSDYGLDGMRQRAALVGGTLRLEQVVPNGTRVVFTAPLD